MTPARDMLGLALRLLLPLALAACAAPGELEALKARQAESNWQAIAEASAPCTNPDLLCAQAQEIRADACQTLARRAPAAPEAPARRACATAAYQAALRALPPEAGKAARRRLLANAAAAAMDQRDHDGLGLNTQLAAAEALLALDPHDPAGCYHAASARLARALLRPAGPGQCAELPPLPACAGVAAPPGTPPGARLPLHEIIALRGRLGCP